MTDPNDDIRLLYESTWLSAPDLRGRDVTLTIARVQGGEVIGEGGKKNKKPILHWEEKMRDGKTPIKPMPLNKTNRKIVSDLYGTGYSIKALVGKRVTLYPTTTRMGGQQVDCVRIRNVKPGEKKPNEAPPDVAPSDNPDEGP